MENTKKVPSGILMTAVGIFVVMFFYAAFLDNSFPEKTVKGFYQSWMSADYQDAAENLSVLWANVLVPEYADTEMAVLLEQRGDVEDKMADALKAAQAYALSSESMRIEILMDSIVKGKVTALVPFQVFDKNSEALLSTEVALLVKEGSGYKLVNAEPIAAEYLPQVMAMDLSAWDALFQ